MFKSTGTTQRRTVRTNSANLAAAARALMADAKPQRTGSPPASATQLKPLPQQVGEGAWQRRGVAQHDVKGKGEGVHVLGKHGLAAYKADGLQQGSEGRGERCISRWGQAVGRRTAGWLTALGDPV